VRWRSFNILLVQATVALLAQHAAVNDLLPLLPGSELKHAPRPPPIEASRHVHKARRGVPSGCPTCAAAHWVQNVEGALQAYRMQRLMGNPKNNLLTQRGLQWLISQ